MRRFSIAAVLAAAVLAAFAWWHRDDVITWQTVDRIVRARHPSVQQVSTAEVADRIERGEAPLLLDVRTQEEYAVSHLPDARRLDPDLDGDALADAVADLDRGRDVVVYCSVGVRSARMADALEDLGFGSVRNLDGSAFRWATEGRPLETSGGADTDVVHPYDAVWGRLLPPGLRAPL